jgi:hemoglobin
MKSLQRLTFVVLIGLVVAGCARSEKKSMMAEPSMATEQTLYHRLGGKEAISAMVDGFVVQVATDSRVNSFFATTNVPNFKRLLVAQICEATGGPCTYTGRDMATVHQGLGITDADFNAVVEDLVVTLDTFKVPAQEKNELLALLAPMRKDIVGK